MGIKKLIIKALKEKTAWPVIFLLVVSLGNYLIISGYFQSENKLKLKLAKASVSASTASVNNISQSSLKDGAADVDVGEENTSAIYDKFLKNNFIAPTTGKNWGVLHGHNGVDIADSCGKTIYAAEEGIVTQASASGQWNEGYGNFLVIKHPSGASTKYAHTKKNLVSGGSYVLQGDPIALIGNTGFTHGVTGCHLHFEVLGGKNPFVR